MIVKYQSPCFVFISGCLLMYISTYADTQSDGTFILRAVPPTTKNIQASLPESTFEVTNSHLEETMFKPWRSQQRAQ
jgi:hypothetical protein